MNDWFEFRWSCIKGAWQWLIYSMNTASTDAIVDALRHSAEQHDELRNLRWEVYQLKQRPTDFTIGQKAIQDYIEQRRQDKLEKARRMRGFEQIQRLRCSKTQS